MDDVRMEMGFRVWVHLEKKRHPRAWCRRGMGKTKVWGGCGSAAIRSRGGWLTGMEGRSGVKDDELKRQVGPS